LLSWHKGSVDKNIKQPSYQLDPGAAIADFSIYRFLNLFDMILLLKHFYQSVDRLVIRYIEAMLFCFANNQAI
jgi:hypothetical protein